jgi:Papain family cysteine protease
VKAKVAGSDRLLNVEPSPAREDDWPARKDGVLEDTRPAPERDLREGRPWFKVQNQGQTGSCVGFALADAVLRWQLTERGRLEPTQRLSARFIWMASKEIRAQRLAIRAQQLAPEEWWPSTFLEEAPTNVKDALDVVRRYGAVRREMLPWNGRLNRGPVQRFFERADKFRIAAYHSLDDTNPVQRELQWRQWIDQHGPVLLTVKADLNLIDGESPLQRFRPRKEPFLHACALVGYDADGFVIRNSWGTGWGDAGDIVATSRWLDRAAEESYGVVL